MTKAQYLDLSGYLIGFKYINEEAAGGPLFAAGTPTITEKLTVGGEDFPVYVNEFWTARQRQASSIHEISYRGCFKPQLPRFFIELTTSPGDRVYDPFSGRGTTAIEAGLLGRRVAANDVNPLSALLCRPRLFPPDPDALKQRLGDIPMDPKAAADRDLSMFFDPRTLAEIISLKNYLAARHDAGAEDELDAWIRMTATNRLTGHSVGFFSVYTLPPNQAASPQSQVKINEKRNQVPTYRDTRKIILKKSKQLLGGLSRRELENLRQAGRDAVFLTRSASYTPEIEAASVDLIVTSPPFLDVVQYAQDNWLRCWFNGLDAEAIGRGITMSRKVVDWSKAMTDNFRELYRIVRPGGRVCFEVGEVKNGRVKLDEVVIPVGLGAGFHCEGVLINMQEFTKTSNIWGIGNNKRGTNTNRIVMFRKEG